MKEIMYNEILPVLVAILIVGLKILGYYSLKYVRSKINDINDQFVRRQLEDVISSVVNFTEEYARAVDKFSSGKKILGSGGKKQFAENMLKSKLKDEFNIDAEDSKVTEMIYSYLGKNRK